MSPHDIHPDKTMHDPDRENLSALFDGALPEDAARFAMRRLDHDTQWREACGRWQLLGDALRGQASASAPPGFAARVEAALAAERASAPPAQPASDVHGGSRVAVPPPGRWSRSRIGGAALAASVAFAALLVVRPGFDEAAPVATDEPAALAATTSEPAAPAPVPATPVASVPQATASPSPASPESQLGLAAAAVAVAELPRRARGQGTRSPGTRSQAQRAALRQRQAEAPVQIAIAAPGQDPNAIGGGIAVATLSAGATATTGPHPFLPEAEEIPSRPWPRATVPAAGGAFTVRYDASGAGSRSFYPFEPRMPQAAAVDESVVVPAFDGPRR